ncbi:MAG: FG-GAP-like repeat-containing protein, partial [Anaerolineae bacterium]
MSVFKRLLFCGALAAFALVFTFVFLMPIQAAMPLLQPPGNPILIPPANTHSVPTNTTVSVIYDQPINAATVSSRTFAVYGMQTGLLTQTHGVAGSTIVFTPTLPFKPGELVQVSATTGTLSTGGLGPITPTVWQFWADVRGSNGSFSDSGQSLGSSDSDSVALGDLNGDGSLDAFVANYAQANKIWLNDGAGNFSDSGQNLGGSNSNSVVLGDLDKDGDLDAFVTNNGQANKVWLNDGAGAFTDSGQSLGSSLSGDAALGDVEGDGDLDAFIANDLGGNKVWLNDGTGVFSDSGQSLGSSGPSGVALGDVDGDGDLDAFVASNNQVNQVWLNSGTGVFTDSGQSLGSSASSFGVALGDVDGDGDLDAFVANWNGQANTVWLNDGAGNFSDSGQSLGNSFSWRVALGDVEGDGDLDAFVANDNNQANTVWLNDGAGNFSDSGQSLSSSSSRGLALGDVDDDGDLDAFVGNATVANTVWLNGAAVAAASNLYHPLYYRNYAGLTSTLFLQNPNPASANVVVTAYDSSGAPQANLNFALAPNGGQIVPDSDFTALASGSYSLIVSAGQPLESVVNLYGGGRDRLATYRGVSGGSTVQYFGPFYKPAGIGGSSSNLLLWNIGTAGANVTAQFYDPAGSFAFSQNYAIPPDGQLSLTAAGLTGLPDGFSGQAVISADQPFVGLLSTGSGAGVNFLDGPLGAGAPDAALIRALKNQNEAGDPRTTTLFVANLDTQSTDVTLGYKDAAGTIVHSATFTLPPFGSTSLNLAADNALLSNNVWAATVISNTAGQALGISEMSSFDFNLDIANGTYSTGADPAVAAATVNLPRIANTASAYTVFSLYNAGGSPATLIPVYYNPAGTATHTGSPEVIQPGGWVRHNQSQMTAQLGGNFQGSVTVSSDQPLLAFVDEYLPVQIPVFTGTLYVAGTSGSDLDNLCQDPNTPCKTIGYALSQASSGATVLVAGGTYTENPSISGTITLMGGYGPISWTRDIAQYETIIDGSSSLTTVGDWDGSTVGKVSVINDGGTYKMWFDGRNLFRETKIGLATSPDGIAWTKYSGNPVLTGTTAAASDYNEEHAPFVLKDGATYKMWYEWSDGNSRNLAYATSSDGITWSEYAGNPVLQPGPDGYDQDDAAHGSLLKEGNVYKLWYHAIGDQGPIIAYATSGDGIAWAKQGPALLPNPGSWDDSALWGPSVLNLNGVYWMWYSGADANGPAGIGVVTSTNGISWTRFLGGPVLTETGAFIGDPHVITDAG